MYSSSKIIFACFLFISCKQPAGFPVKQQDIERVNQMANLPQPLEIIDYQKLALEFDSTVYDFNAKGNFGRWYGKTAVRRTSPKRWLSCTPL